MMTKTKPNAPVLFIVFNRPETTTRVFEAIRKAQPPRLYVAADGPRQANDSDIKLTQLVRKIATNIDWECELHTSFNNENLGCGRAPAAAISWFFQNEEAGIILEDDCLPHPDFFHFCNWALSSYKNDKAIWHIAGNNFEAPLEIFSGESVSYSALAQVWGWATWRDRWKHYIYNPFYLSELTDEKSTNWQLSEPAKVLTIHHIDLLKNGLKTWDYQWQITILNARGLAVCSSSNLISNIGQGPNATHTEKDSRSELSTQPIVGELKKAPIDNNQELTSHYEKNMGRQRMLLFVKLKLFNLYSAIATNTRNILRTLLLEDTTKIVIASTGRAGSTMLYDSISHAYIKKKFPRIEKIRGLHMALKKLSREGCDRLTNLNKSKAVILKTHDIYREENNHQVKYIFVYSDPLDSAASANRMTQRYGHHWFLEHQYHLVASGCFDNLFKKDTLNYVGQIRSWLQAENDAVFCINYNDIWEKEDELAKFLELPLKLPTRRDRDSSRELNRHINKELFDSMRQEYKTTSGH